MLHFLLDNVFNQVGGRVFQQCVGTPMGTHCAPLSAELLLHDYESNAMIWFSKTNGHTQAKSALPLREAKRETLRFHDRC